MTGRRLADHLQRGERTTPMGIGNVKRVYAQWGTLPEKPFRVLVWMAAVSLDHDDPPLYFAGRDTLVFAMGRTLPDADDEASGLQREAAYRALKRVMRTLKSHGAVSVVRRGGSGRYATYALCLAAQQGVGHRPPIERQGDGDRPPKRVTDHPPEGDVQRPVGGRSPSPIGEEEQRRINSRSGGPRQAVTSPAVIDRVIAVLREETGHTVTPEHAAAVARQIGPGERNTLAYVEKCVRRDPVRFLPTPTPPRFTAAGGFETV
jgi:hypothetical protein